MAFTDTFIRRPVLAIVLSMLVLLMGLKAFGTLQLRQYPQLIYPKISITTVYSGASASLIKGFITTPILNAITSVEGISYVTAQSDEGVSSVSVYLTQNYDVDTALLDISSKVNTVRKQFPIKSENPLVEKESGVGEGALQYLAFSSSIMEETQITDYLSKVVVPKLSTVEGMGKVDLIGQRSFAMRVWLNSDNMAALNVTAIDIDNALRNSNFQSAAGQTKNSRVVFNVSADTSLNTVEEFEKIIVKSDNATLIRLSDVARVELGAENYDQAIWYGGAGCVFLKTSSAPTANLLIVAERVRELLPVLQKQLPSVLTMDMVFDATRSVDASITEVVKTLIEASLIVVIVIMLFLGTFRSVVIPIVAIPLSLVGVLSVMLLMGFSVNLLTLLAMVLAIGLVVDDAIVVVENIQRHIEQGTARFEAALLGAREIAFPVIAMTVTLAAVYLPIGFLGGLTGTLFTEFAFTLAGAVIVSGIIALTLSPMMCSQLLVYNDSNHSFVARLDKLFDSLKCRYQSTLLTLIHYRWVVLVFSVFIIICIFFLYKTIPKELAPQEDDGVVFFQGNAPLSVNFDYVEKYAEQVEKITEKISERSHGFVWVRKNSLFSIQILKSWSDRDRSNEQIRQTLQADLVNVAGLQVFSFNFPSLPGAAGGLPIQFVLISTDSEEVIFQVASNMMEQINSSGLFSFVRQDLRFDKPELLVHINRDRAAQLGITMKDIGSTLSILLGESNTGRFSEDNSSYKVIPQVEGNFRMNPKDLTNYYIKTKTGESVSLDVVVSLSVVTKPNKLNQFQQLNSTTIAAALAPGVTIGDAVEYLDHLAENMLPDGFSHSYVGQARQFNEEGNVLLTTFMFSFLLIYLVLAAQFESFRDPIIVLISVPMSICGALVPMALGAATMNIYTQIGLVTLIGLISKHGILIVDFANKLQRQGLTVVAAVEHAAVVRFRPVLMTTAAMVFGVVPLLLATGAGAQSRHDIGIVIAAGMSIGTVFTLYVVPVLYTYISPTRVNNC